MPRRYLFGPVLPEHADHYLQIPRRDGWCLAFNQAGTADLALAPTESWESICAHLPTGWFPDFLVLKLSYGTVPTDLWSAPLPLIGFAEDWNLLWHGYRHNLHRCDLVLTDTVGVEALRKEGMDHARWANLYGCGHAYLQAPASDHERDIDILFVGNMNPAVQRERLPWLTRLACLADRWRVVIQTGMHGDAYRELLKQARIVFNRSIREECNQRAFEATTLGALLFQEGDNHEVPRYFRNRHACIYYGEHNLDELLEYYLGHEEEHRALAEAGRRRAHQFSFLSLWNAALREVLALDPQHAEVRNNLRVLLNCGERGHNSASGEATAI